MIDTPAIMVTSPAQLEHVLDEVRAAGRMGLDTEFLREKTYFARLCLAQVSTPNNVFLIDPLQSLDASRLSDLLADPAIEVVVHAGWQDLQLFYQRTGCVPARVFDVQLAAGFAGYGASMAYGRLVEEVAGVTLEKGEAYSDWCHRPLTARQLTYAADDVRYLLPVADKLKARLARQGRSEWLAEEMRSLELSETYAPDDEVWRKVAGQGNLSPRQATVLREVALWREEVAAQRDLPRGWLIKDATLIEIARRAPDNVAGLKSIRGMDGREAERSGSGILEAIARGRIATAIQRAPAPDKTAQMRARMIVGLADAVLRSRAEEAEIAPEIVASRSDVEALLLAILSPYRDPGGERLMKGWRRTLAGEPILALATGQCGLRVIDHPPYIEEVPVEA